MSDVYRFRAGERPLLISVPHDGREIPRVLRARMTDIGLAIPDTDWHVEELYEFAKDLGASIIVANYSRYVVDLNRPADDGELYPGQTTTGLCPEQTFSGAAIYRSGSVNKDEKVARVEHYWRPYHVQIGETLNAMRAEHGFSLLWDAHSIPSLVPRLFDGELPALNLGTNSGASCKQSIEDAVAGVAAASKYSSVVNGRFKGGHITRHFGDPNNDIHALQLEIAQRAYMDEKTTTFDTVKAGRLRDTLQKMLQSYLDAAQK